MQFSIIVPTYNRPTRLRECLEGLAALDYPSDQFEVVIADDGSSNLVEPLLRTFSDRLPIALVGSHKTTGPGAARNRGAARARGRYLAFIDDDCVPLPNWLTALAARFEKSPGSLVGGAIVNALLDNPFSTATQLIMTYVYQYHDRQGQGKHFFNTANLAVSAEAFRRFGGFSEAVPLAEDYDFCQRWLHAGYRTIYAPEVIVHHRHTLTLASFCRQHFSYGRGLFRCRLRMADRVWGRLRGEAFPFYLGLVRFPLQQVRGSHGWTQVALVGLSQIMTAAGVIREGLPQGLTDLTSRHRRKADDRDDRREG
jgi:GT2 family glycosyltransferase